MTIQNFRGNVLKSNAKIIAHQVNCIGVMGAGLARQIAQLYPQVYEVYKNTCYEHHKDFSLLGQVLFVPTADNKIIANCFAQYEPGYTLQTDYPSLKKCLRLVEQKAKIMECSVAIPYKIGCGLAGGNWEIVESIIKNIFENSEVPLQIYEL